MFFDSFGIDNYDFSDYEHWVGKTGVVRVKHSSYNGKINATVPFCLSRGQQEKFVTEPKETILDETIDDHHDSNPYNELLSNKPICGEFVF